MTFQRSTAEKYERALAKVRGQRPLYQLPDGSFKFGGNKFVPQRIVSLLPITPFMANNRGWMIWLYDEESDVPKHMRSIEEDEPEDHRDD